MTEFFHRSKRKKWITDTFGPELLPLEPFDLDPVTDIPIRLAVEEGVIKKNNELALYRLTQDWGEFSKGSIILAGSIEEGKPFAVWVGGRKKKENTDEDLDDLDNEKFTDES